jgi:hypothetical protein
VDFSVVALISLAWPVPACTSKSCCVTVTVTVPNASVVVEVTVGSLTPVRWPMTSLRLPSGRAICAEAQARTSSGLMPSPK